MGLSGEPSPEGEEKMATSCSPAADDASPADRVLKELQSIRRSQRRMEALLGRMLCDAAVLPRPAFPETSDPASPSSSTMRSTAMQSQRRATTGTDSDVDQGEDSDQSSGSAKRVITKVSQCRRSVSHFRGLDKQSSQDRLEYCKHFNSMLSKDWGTDEFSLRPSGSSGRPPDTFIAATLPLSWPTVLPARSTYEKDRQSPKRTVIKNTVVACSRMWSPSGASETLQVRNWRPWLFTISPGSGIHMVLCFLSFVVLLYDFTVIPVVLAWDLQMTGFLYVTGVMSVLFWSADMGLSFMTAFYVKGELIVRPAAIAKRYLRTWFTFDFIAVGGDWASIALQSLASSGDGSSAGNMRLIRLVKIARLLRIMGVLRMLRFLNVVREYVEKKCSGYYRVAMKTVSLLLGIMLLTHTMCCAWYAIGKLGPSDTGMRWTDVFNDSPLEHDSLYQYATSFHWAAAQMTLGATDVNSNNSVERSVNVVCMLIGLIFSCTLVSSLSATLVDFSIAHKDQTQKMDAIRKYLKESYISATTCLLVEDQISERLREESKTLFYEGESCLQKLLSQRLFARLRHEVFLPTISTHPLLRLWGSMHEPTMHRLAVEAFEFRALQVADDLFAAGARSNAAYFVIDGELEYTQRPDSSPESKEVSKTVGPGTWLCEAALWSKWIHVGSAVAKQRTTLALLKAEELWKVSSEHAVIKTVVASYGEVFHGKIVRAVPPEEWPNDLVVPSTSLAQIVISMSREAQVAIGWNVLHRCRGELLGFRGLAAKAFGGSLNLQWEKLEEEVTTGKSAVIQVGQEVQRVVSIACVRLVDECQRVLVQIGKGQEAGQVMSPVCQLPGQKLDEEITAAEKLVQVLEAKIPCLTGNSFDIERVDREEKMELSRFFLLKTTYFRTIITARFRGVCEAELVPLETPQPQSPLGLDHQSHRGSVRKHNSKAASESTLLEDMMKNNVYHVKDVRGVSMLYTWLPEEVFEELLTKSSGHALVAQWIRKLANHFRVQVPIPPGPGHERQARDSDLSVHGFPHSHFNLRGSRTSNASGFLSDYEQELSPPLRVSGVTRRSIGRNHDSETDRAHQVNSQVIDSQTSSAFMSGSGGRLFNGKEPDEGDSGDASNTEMAL